MNGPTLQALHERVEYLEEMATSEETRGRLLHADGDKLINSAQARRADAWAIKQVIKVLAPDQNGAPHPGGIESQGA